MNEQQIKNAIQQANLEVFPTSEIFRHNGLVFGNLVGEISHHALDHDIHFYLEASLADEGLHWCFEGIAGGDRLPGLTSDSVIEQVLLSRAEEVTRLAGRALKTA